MKVKTCTICKVNKPVKEFYIRKKVNKPFPDCKVCNKAKRRREYSAHPEKSRRWSLISKYGLTDKDYDLIWQLQGEKCALCGRTKTLNEKNFAVDHDHRTGQIRGILCLSCNGHIGALGDTVESLEKALAYIRRASPVSWDTYFLDQASLLATRSRDMSTQVGAVLVKDRRIIATGYNGFPLGSEETIKRNLRPEKYYYYVHAEMNCINSCARSGIKVKGSTMYVTPLFPCNECAKSIINSGISKIIVRPSEYGKGRMKEPLFSVAKQMFKEAGIPVIQLANVNDL